MVKPKKCKWCKNEFTPQNSLAQVCSYECSIALARSNGLKKMESEKETLRATKDKKKQESLVSALQVVINHIAKEIDKGCTCISCGCEMRTKAKSANDSKGINGGHYFGVGRNNSIRYNLFNIFAQCINCNKDKDGNGSNYAKNIRVLFGDEFLLYLLDLPAMYPSNKMLKFELQEAITRAKHILKGVIEMNEVDTLPRTPERRWELRNQFNKHIGIYD
jgi:hypothetical protein